jgi:hypothetical protein
MLELDRLENVEKKVDETHPAEGKESLQGSTTLKQAENEIGSKVGKDKENAKENKEMAPSSLEEAQAGEH